MKGKLLVIDGTDGSGKTVQTELLIQHLQADGHDVVLADFPRYAEESSYFVRKMLKGEYGTLEEQPPYRSSYFYALDRFDASFQMKKDLEAGKIIVSNRYTSSNIGHQGAKFSSDEEREQYFQWLDHFEYDELGIPRPDAVFFLHVPTEITLGLIEERLVKNERSTKDIAEEDHDHLRASCHSYLQATAYFDYWKKIECTNNATLLSPESIHQSVYAEVEQLLTVPVLQK